MAYQDDIALMAHLMRRAGFGATRDELETRVARGYENTVEELLHPETQPPVDAYSLLRYQPASLLPGGQPPMGNGNSLYYLCDPKRPAAPYGRFPWKFEYRRENHDDGGKVFLGHKGRFNGEDILDIVVQQPACGKFICRHLYNFFVADEPQVPAWPIEAPRDQEAVDTLVGVFRDSKFDIRSVLRVMFNSDFFKEARFQHVKSPAEVVVSTLRFAGGQ